MTTRRTELWVRRTVSILVVLGTLGFGVGTASAGPWVEPAGEGYLKVSGEYFGSQENYDVEGRAGEATPSYSHVGARTYGEVGVFRRVSLGWSLPVVSAVNRFDDGRSYRRTGLGDLDARLDVQIFSGTCALAGEFEARVPLYSGTVGVGDSATASTSSGGADQFEPVLGDGSREFAPGLAFGCGVPLPGWVTASAGPRFRFDGFADGIDWSVGAGAYVVPERLAVTLGGSGRERFAAHDPRPTKRYAKARAGILFELSRSVALEGSAGYTLDGAFVARGWSGALGVSYQGRLFPDPFGDGS